MSKLDTFGKFFVEAVETRFKDTIFLYSLKEAAMRQWEEGILTDSEHCDIEAWLDKLLEEF